MGRVELADWHLVAGSMLVESCLGCLLDLLHLLLLVQLVLLVILAHPVRTVILGLWPRREGV